MNEQTSATALRYQAAIKAMKHEQFFKHPQTQAEVIATHYCSLAILSLNLLEMIKLRHHLQGSEQLDIVIEHHIGEIKRHHLNDFGIELEWNKPPL